MFPAVLRPEVLESIYYAYRATGDPKYQDWTYHAISSILNTTRVGSGYSYINDVNVVGGGGNQNFQDSFFFAETLKYSYLIFQPVSCGKMSYRRPKRESADRVLGRGLSGPAQRKSDVCVHDRRAPAQGSGRDLGSPWTFWWAILWTVWWWYTKGNYKRRPCCAPRKLMSL